MTAFACLFFSLFSDDLDPLTLNVLFHHPLAYSPYCLGNATATVFWTVTPLFIVFVYSFGISANLFRQPMIFREHPYHRHLVPPVMIVYRRCGVKD
jgi:hypothetical protein